MKMESKIKKAKIISILVVSLAFFLLLTLVFQFLYLNNLEKKNQELSNTLSNLESVIADYSKQKDYYTDRENYLDEYAHEVLNMSKEGETWYATNKK